MNGGSGAGIGGRSGSILSASSVRNSVFGPATSRSKTIVRQRADARRVRVAGAVGPEAILDKHVVVGPAMVSVDLSATAIARRSVPAVGLQSAKGV